MERQTVITQFTEWIKLKISLHTSDDIDYYFREREIWWASLGANVGYEQDGKNQNFERPVLVLKKFNKYILWVLPLTSTIKDNKYYFKISHNGKEYSIVLSQLRLISSKRLIRKNRVLPKEEFNRVREKVRSFI